MNTMSYSRRIQPTTSFDESVMTAMAVVPQNNNRNVTTMYHPVIEGVNPSGSNVACLNKCMKIPSNFTMEDGTEVLLVNMSARGAMIMYRYQFNDRGHIVKVDSVKTPFDVNQYRLQKPVSGVIKIYCNTITGTDFTLSGQVSALALYDLPEPVPNYEDLAKYSIMPTFSRINVSLEDGVALVLLPTPWEFQTPAIVDGSKETISEAEARTQEPISCGSIVAPANTDDLSNINIVTLGSGFYTCGTRVALVVEGETGSNVDIAIHLTDGGETITRHIHNDPLQPGIPVVRVFDIPDRFDTVIMQVGTRGPVPTAIRYSLYSLDPLMYLDSDLKNLVYIQGSLSPKNIIVSGELRKQIVPLTEYIPVTEMRLPVPYDPKVFEACAILAQMPDYGIVMKRSEYEGIGVVSLDNVACVATGECGIADYWKMVVAALKKVGVQPAQLGRKILAAGAKYGKNLLDYAEEQGFAQDGDENMQSLRFGTCSDSGEHSYTPDFSIGDVDFHRGPKRGAAVTQPRGHETRTRRTQRSSWELAGIRKNVPLTTFQTDPIHTRIVTHFQQSGYNQRSTAATKHHVRKTVQVPNMAVVHTQRKVATVSIPIISRSHQVGSKDTIPSRHPVVERSSSRQFNVGWCMDAKESQNTLNFEFSDDEDTDQENEVIEEGETNAPKSDEIREEVELKNQAAKEQAKVVEFEKQDIKEVDVNAPENFLKYAIRKVKCELGVSTEDYKRMAIFKYNGGWKQYVSNLLATTTEGRLQWKQIVADGATSENVKSTVTRQNMVDVDPSKKAFQPFIVQVENVPTMATVVVSFSYVSTPGYTIYPTCMDNVKLALDSKMQTKEFGATNFMANGENYIEDPVGLGELLGGTTQWRALFMQLGSNARSVDPAKTVYITIEFDTWLDTLAGGSFIGALDCAMFGECPFIFPEYTMSYFDPVSWPTLVAKEFKQVVFESRVAKKFLPEWWPTAVPVSVWYETPKSFASWKKVAVVKPVPFSTELAANITSNPILAGPFDRTWILRFNPPQILKMKADYGEQYVRGLVTDLEKFRAPSTQAQARFDRNLNNAKALLSGMTLNKWNAMKAIVTPSQASFMDAARYGMTSAYPAALGSLNTLLSQIDSVGFYKIYNRTRAFRSHLQSKNLRMENMTPKQLAHEKKLFSQSRSGGTQTRMSKADKKRNQREKTERLFEQLSNQSGDIVTYSETD